ncbi:MAG: HYR domain-containing protein, partial [Bacteroidetes bacterium]
YVLSISARDPYDQGDVTLDNDPDECGAEFTWLHPILFDNCPGGFVQMQIIYEEDEEQVNTLLPIFPENTEITYFFEVGVTEVRYTLTDAAGNTSTCGFEVEVLDVQFPTLTCPPDLVIQLEGGECTTTDYPTIPVTADDNCPGFTFSSIPPGTPVPIGDTIITLIVTDASGNATECTYNLSVLEFIPEGPPACVANQNVTLGPDCEAEITADMVLSGDDYRCYDNYIVSLFAQDEDGNPGAFIESSPFVGLDFVGQEIIAEVCDPATGLCCWGYVLIEFKDAPEFICPADTTVRCTDSTLPRDLGEPVVTSCVPGGALIEFDDRVVDNGMCGDPRLRIERTWTVTDGEGNSSTCLQTIIVEPFELSEVVFPSDTTVNCALALADPSVLSTDSLGVPMINDSIPVSVVSLCSGAVNMIEDRFDICENSYIIFRTWRVINQCDENPLANAITRVQTIRVEDVDGPDLICPDDQVSSTGPNECLGNYQVPPLVVGDACSAVTYQVAIDGDTLPYRADHQYLAIGLEVGQHEVRYIATDECGKWSSCAYTLTVADLIEPYASCDDQLNISIGGGDINNGAFGIHRVYATEVNEGSSDNCSEVSVLVRREILDPQAYDCLLQFDYNGNGRVLNDEVRRDPDDFSSPNGWFTPWSEYADFTCCDVGQSILVELQVTDQAGNSNVCWQYVVPEDKLRPYCTAPDNVSLSCLDLPLTFPGDIVAAYDEDRSATVSMLNALFGAPTATDNCRVDTIVENRPSVNLNDCGWGTITRRFEAWQLNPAGDANANGLIDRDEVLYSINNCAQLITITETHEFTIDFPEDAALNCTDPCIPEIEVTMPGCDNVLVNTSEPQRFEASGDECYKLGITYDVINWCIWDGEYVGTTIKRRTEDDGEALPVDRAVESSERPVLRVSGPDRDNLTVVLDRRHPRRRTCGVNVPGDDSRLADDETIGRSTSTFQNNEDWNGILDAGRWQYTQYIKVYDDTAPEVTNISYNRDSTVLALCTQEQVLEDWQFVDPYGNCDAEVNITFAVSDVCDVLDGSVDNVTLVSAELDGFAVDANNDGDIKANEFVADNIPFSLTTNDGVNYTFSGTFPIIDAALGNNVYHALRVVFEDGCANRTSAYIKFDVIDCKGPAPSCINGITITLMPQPEGGCSMATWASDFEASAIYDCTGQGPEVNPDAPQQERVTKLAIYRQTDVENDPNFVPNPNDTGLVLTEEDDATTFVYVYGFDEDGNYDYCTTYIQVESHVDCSDDPGTGNLSGTIMREDATTVEGVEMTVSGGQSASVTTGVDGYFRIAGLATGTDFTLTPFRNDDHDNGVTTFDIVLISKHILGTDLFASPYQMLAADVNRSGTITTLDMIQIRKLILNIDTEFANNTSWRFVRSDYEFPQASNPWLEEFPELYNVNNFGGSIIDVDFVAIKVGDVNNSARANSLEDDGRTLNGIFHLEMD